MAKTNKKLSVKKETLRKLDSLTDEQLGRVAGGTLEGYGLVVPPSFTLSCGCDTTTGLCLQNVSLQNYVKIY